MFRSWLHPTVLKGQREPWHLPKVLIIESLVLVTRAEDDLHDLAVLVSLVIKLDEEGCELAARWAIVHAEVEDEKLGLAAAGCTNCRRRSAHLTRPI